jgi:sigma-B regulation protein RsbU (phosphoserine phosphatase)
MVRRRFAGFRTIRGRMLFWILAATMPIYAGALYMSYRATAQRLEDEAQRDADDLAARLAAGMDAVIRPIEGGIRTVASQLEEIDPPREQYPARIRGILAAWPDVYGSTIAVEATRDNAATGQPFAPYLFRHAGDIAYSDLASASYAYRELPWYRLAADSQRPVWSAPYFDAGGGEAWMVTYSVPFFRRYSAARRDVAGVVTADLDLDWVRKAAANVRLGSGGMGWLVSPPAPRVFLTPIGATARRLETFDASLDANAIREVGERMLTRGVTFRLLPQGVSTQPAYLAARTLETLDWRVMLVFPESDLLSAARALLRRQLWLGAIGFVILIGAISLVAAAISRPVRALATAVGTASENHLTFALPDLPRRDEVGVLTSALRRMRDSLREHIELRAASLAAQARLDHELQIATSIQQSMLPKVGSRALPMGVRVAAALLPAKQVGGDLYDYFAVDERSLLFAIADVSDKGIPAALFMARVGGLLRVLATAGKSPDRILHELNAHLVKDNDACMFVTIGCGLLDVETGHIRYASAGHEPPALRTAEGIVSWLPVENGAAIGIDAAAEYTSTDTVIAPGDTLLLFTDGVTEAAANDGSQFGAERLAAVLRDAPDGSPEALVRSVVDTIAAEARVLDDLTVLALSVSPPAVTLHRNELAMHWLIEPEISAAGVAQAQRWLRSILASRAVAPSRIGDAELIAEELLTNVVRSFEARGGSARMSLECELTAAQIVITVRDNGLPFDPLSLPAPNLEGNIDERAIGGLGVVIVRQLADSCHYSHVHGRNVMEVRLHRSPG